MNAWHIAAVLALSVSPLAGAAVYKCQGADGRVEFRDSPCVGSKGAQVEVKPNSVREIDQTYERGKSAEIAQRAQERIDAEASARGTATREAPARYDGGESPSYAYCSYPFCPPRAHHRRPEKTASAPKPSTVPVTPRNPLAR